MLAILGGLLSMSASATGQVNPLRFGGETVPPELYLSRVDVDTDGGSVTRMHPIAVAY